MFRALPPQFRISSKGAVVNDTTISPSGVKIDVLIRNFPFKQARLHDSAPFACAWPSNLVLSVERNETRPFLPALQLKRSLRCSVRAPACDATEPKVVM